MEKQGQGTSLRARKFFHAVPPVISAEMTSLDVD
jgi:hypothetical protein